MKVTCPHCSNEFEIPSTSADEASTEEVKDFIPELVEWKKEFEIGVPELDEQHREMVKILNDLDRVIRLGHRPKNFIQETFRRVQDYAKYHFAFEEQLFLSSNYPEAAAHKNKHRILVEQIAAMEQKIKVDVIDLRAFLRVMMGWWLSHIQEADVKLVPYLNDYIISPKSGD